MQSDYIPTPEEIEAACLLIQSQWSESERVSRGYSRPGTPNYDPDAERLGRLALDAKLAKRRERSSSRAGA